VSRARYDGHAGSSGGAGTYDAMGSWIDAVRWGVISMSTHVSGREASKPASSVRAQNARARTRARTHLSCGVRRAGLLDDAHHRGAGPLRARAAPVLGLALAPGREDRRPERVLEGERGGRERCAARDRELVGRGGEVEVGRERRGRGWGRAGEEEGGVCAGGGFADALEVGEGWGVEAGGFEPSGREGG
jgi:hypothetical protein